MILESFLAGIPEDGSAIDFGRAEWRETWITVLQHLWHVFRLHLKHYHAGRPLMRRSAGYWSQLAQLVDWLANMIDELVRLVSLRLPDHPSAYG
ncbi:MAG: hypothetical protein GEU98_16040 [Pseudonocardiaceae bacterium]|nr:hypothetical protein [Pseudonocardiaceae bacterium]